MLLCLQTDFHLKGKFKIYFKVLITIKSFLFYFEKSREQEIMATLIFQLNLAGNCLDQNS